MNVYDRQLENDGRILHHLGLMLARDEHGTARPQTTDHRPQLVVRCAWCEREGSGERRAESGERISHGICDRHAAAMRAEIDALHNQQAA